MMNSSTNNGAGDNNQSQQPQIDKTKLIVNYIPQFSTEEDIGQIFKQVGKVESIKIMRDFKTGYSYGFGFVKYSTPEEAAKAIEVINGMSYKNKRLKVSYSRPPGTDMRDSNLYVTNLPKDVTEQDIDQMFNPFGEIVQRTVLKDKITGMPRGVAFVRFSKGEEAQNAIANLDGKMLDKAIFPLSVRVAEDHGRQKAQYIDVWNPFMYNRVLSLGMLPFRGIMPFRDMPMNMSRGNFPNRFGRFNNIRNMAAGDSFLQTPFYF
ncbi:sex-lethal homolog isoform X1 [Harmonia axyridis]|uniref:sex-lethal homolog isoform X1 n=2 Tax=Harmonia axyridis TaxID=115357 RepID=UPI001E275B20|nr:sex-lethal homolog isoform X1 [Harmonia axyridis]XP_045466084.1 sex-lethal homolog isoform X1 [Harmonia axyridis]